MVTTRSGAFVSAFLHVKDAAKGEDRFRQRMGTNVDCRLKNMSPASSPVFISSGVSENDGGLTW